MISAARRFALVRSSTTKATQQLKPVVLVFRGAVSLLRLEGIR